jgi:hypothetical protein
MAPRMGAIPAAVDDSYIWGIALDALDQADPVARIINLIRELQWDK